jgi:hypothetical protein
MAMNFVLTVHENLSNGKKVEPLSFIPICIELDHHEQGKNNRAFSNGKISE